MFKTLSKIHAHSLNNKQEINLSKDAACFHCLKKFEAKEVSNFKNETALCPKCGKDTVIGDHIVKGNFIFSMNLEKKLFKELNDTFETGAELLCQTTS